ncbi:MAG: FAD-dependent monooxygenase [Candidatus Melainabacteria bacterium]|nr:FAD-dependent monooxygenase [Candidatus Melainabacteria bacterium]
MISESERLPVLIVGAGPVGLTMALALDIAGIKFRIIDKAPQRSDKSKALGVHARTLELLESLGIVDTFIEHGHIVHSTNIYNGSKKLVHLSLDEIHSPFAFALMIPQSETERILAEELAERGISIEREMEVTTFTQDEDSITTTVKRLDGSEESIQTNWLLGCDGAHSTVRHTLGLNFEGSTYEEGFATIDCYVDWNHAEDELTGFVSEDGIVFFFPMGNRRYRIIADGPMHKPDDPPLTLERMQTIVNDRCGSVIPLSNPNWITWFTINRRSVQQYREGRAFVAGDAAHVHSPVMGQGMNTGMQDALNLAWKIELVEKGIAGPELLNTYQDERHPIGQKLLKNTDAMTKLVTIRNPIAQQVRNHLVPLLAHQDVVQERARKTLSMVGLNYRDSSIVGEFREPINRTLSHPIADVPAWLDFGHGPSPGDRAPDGEIHTSGAAEPSRLFEQIRGFKHFALLFTGLQNSSTIVGEFEKVVEQIRQEYSEFVQCLVISAEETVPPPISLEQLFLLDKEGSLHHKYGAAHSCLYLIRPDGYVGFRSQPVDLDQMRKYFERAYSFRPVATQLTL